METKTKDKFISFLAVSFIGIVGFLFSSYFGSLETKADSESKYNLLNMKVSLILCTMKKEKYCIKGIK